MGRLPDAFVVDPFSGEGLSGAAAAAARKEFFKAALEGQPSWRVHQAFRAHQALQEQQAEAAWPDAGQEDPEPSETGEGFDTFEVFGADEELPLPKSARQRQGSISTSISSSRPASARGGSSRGVGPGGRGWQPPGGGPKRRDGRSKAPAEGHDARSPEHRKLLEALSGSPWRKWDELFQEWDRREERGQVLSYLKQGMSDSSMDAHSASITMPSMDMRRQITEASSVAGQSISTVAVPWQRNLSAQSRATTQSRGDALTVRTNSKGPRRSARRGKREQGVGDAVSRLPSMREQGFVTNEAPCPSCLKPRSRSKAAKDPSSAYPFCNQCYHIDRAALQSMAENYPESVKLRGTVECLLFDRTILLQALREQKEGWRLYRLATQELRNDREVLVAAVRCPGGQGWRALCGAPPKLAADRPIGIEAVRISTGIAFELLAPELRADQGLIHECLLAGNTGKRAHKPSWDSIIDLCKGLKARAGRQKAGARPGEQTGIEITGHDGLMLLEELTATSTALTQPKSALSNPEKVCIMREEEGQMIRIVPLVAILLQRPDGLLLGEVGKWSCATGKMKYMCAYPGGKITEGEWPYDAKSRFARTLFWPLEKGMAWGEPRFHYETRTSRSVGVPTHYLRLLYDATLEGNFDWRPCFVRVPQDMEKLKMRGIAKKRTVPKGQSGLVQRFAARQASSASQGHCLAPDVYVVRERPAPGAEGSDSVTLYAWLPRWEHDWLRTQDDATRILRDWIEDLDVSFLAEHLAAAPVHLNTKPTEEERRRTASSGQT